MEEDKLKFSELCREIKRRIKYDGGAMTGRKIGRSFQGNISYKSELKEALDHLVETEQLIRTAESTGGRPSVIFSLPDEEEND